MIPEGASGVFYRQLDNYVHMDSPDTQIETEYNFVYLDIYSENNV